MLLKREQNKDRLFGVVYTPDEVAFELTRFALDRCGKAPKTILEPSAGDGAFFRAINDTCHANVEAYGFDIDQTAVENLKENFPNARFGCQDFIGYAVTRDCPKYDLVIGNPPYIRRHNFDDQLKANVEQLSEIAAYPLSELKNAWAAFVVASSLLLSDTGVLAFVVPYELLNVKYGQYLQAFLSVNFSSVEVFTPHDKAFRKLDQDAVALVATKTSSEATAGLILNSVKTLARLQPIRSRSICFSGKQASSVDLNSIFFDDETASLLHKLRSSLKTVGDFATSSAGVVTAANDFFILKSKEIEERELARWARPILKKGAYLPSGPTFTKENLDEISEHEPAFLLDFIRDGAPPLTQIAQQYIAEGEALGLNQRYKSRHRSPWYNIPIVEASDGIFFKRSHSFPRLTINEAKVLVTDTAYQVTMREGFSIRGLSYSFYNSLVLLFCEMDGRFYGGGVLELTPKEFRGIPIHFQDPNDVEFHEFIERFPKSKSPQSANFDHLDRKLAKELSLSTRQIVMVQEALRSVKMHRLRHGSKFPI
ncbi:MAG: Eco57I restriction-modification methylase domain-containing protein [Rhizobiaceae bacterium]|nr:Eco57I restriction-modification methylase domain-containing protein [Rhizobiaceae bacterium]